jgi:hypothetical protein
MIGKKAFRTYDLKEGIPHLCLERRHSILILEKRHSILMIGKKAFHAYDWEGGIP